MKRRMNTEYDNEMREKIQSLIDQCYPTFRIASALGLADGTLRYWIRKLNLSASKNGILIKDDKRFKRCPTCDVVKEVGVDFRLMKRGICSWCIPCEKKRFWEQHRGFKQKCVDYKGSKCQLCGYQKCLAAMDFHHKDPSQKDYQISGIRTKPWEMVRTELDKCILLCRNCHAELHDAEGWLHNKLDGECM